MNQINQLRRQLQEEQQKLSQTREAIAQFAELIEEEQKYTQRLVDEAQSKKPEPQPEAIAPPKPSLSKLERVGQMDDEQLLAAMSSPQRMEKLFKDL